jgi:excisionase family DNA binding protein
MASTELLTVSQAAEALSASTQTIRNWIRGDRLHGVRIGNRFLIPRAEIERMRGDDFAVSGEGVWDFDENEPGRPLPRAGERRGPGSAEELLGG